MRARAEGQPAGDRGNKSYNRLSLLIALMILFCLCPCLLLLLLDVVRAFQINVY